MLEELRRSDRPSLVLRPDPEASPASVALLAGSFDPITVAHAAMAAAALDRAELVVLLYSARTLPKEPGAPPSMLEEIDRLALLDRVVAGRRGLAVGVCSHGLLAEQVEAATERFPGAELRVVLGSDKLMQLFDRGWYRDRDAALDSMFARARVLYAVRSGDEDAVAAVLSANGRWRGFVERLDVPPEIASISSRDVRERRRRGEDVSGLVP